MSSTQDKLITEQAVRELLGISRPTIHRWRKTLPGFPKPLQVGPRAIRYSMAAVQAFIAARQEV